MSTDLLHDDLPPVPPGPAHAEPARVSLPGTTAGAAGLTGEALAAYWSGVLVGRGEALQHPDGLVLLFEAGTTSGERDGLTALLRRVRGVAAALPTLLADPGGPLHEIGRALLTQNNRATDAPIFIVEEKHRVYGFDTAYSDDVAWLDTDSEEASPEEHARLEAGWEESSDEPDGWTRTAYQDEWRFVTACFTEAGCQQYIQRNGHNHRGELRIYAAGSYRNEEFRTVRTFLMERAAGAASSVDDAARRAQGRAAVERQLAEIEGDPHSVDPADLPPAASATHAPAPCLFDLLAAAKAEVERSCDRLYVSISNPHWTDGSREFRSHSWSSGSHGWLHRGSLGWLAAWALDHFPRPFVVDLTSEEARWLRGSLDRHDYHDGGARLRRTADLAGGPPPGWLCTVAGIHVVERSAYTAPPERLCVAVLVTNAAGEVLLVRSAKPGRAWELPGGWVEEGEALDDAALREIEQEAGLRASLRGASLKMIAPRTWVYLGGTAEGEPKAGSDATHAVWIAAKNVLELHVNGLLSDLASRDVLLAWARGGQ
jgi:ADP-ribose pyrophosphatase YjhB (NUDIX family)